MTHEREAQTGIVTEKESGRVIATGVSADDYMEHYAHLHCEWVGGKVIKMSPVSLRHDNLHGFLRAWIETYLALKPIGIVLGDQFMMRMDDLESRRQPDLQIILNENRENLKPTYMNGPADIVIEIVSPSTASTDYGDKMLEYEKGGVREYWLIDPIRTAARFLRLNADGLYQTVLPDDEGYYTTPLLPDFKLPVKMLWQDDLPDILTVVAQVRQVVEGTD